MRTLDVPTMTFGLIRKIFKVADTWFNGGDICPVDPHLLAGDRKFFLDGSPRSEFRRAYLAGWQASRISTSVLPDGSWTMSIGETIVVSCHDGRYHRRKANAPFPSLGPRSISELSADALAAFRKAFADAINCDYLETSTKFENVFKRRQRGLAVSAIKAYCDHIDPQTIAAFRKSNSTDVLEWVNRAPTPDARKHRAQLAGTYPVLIAIVLPASKEKDLARFERAVDMGSPWREHLQHVADPATIRLLHGVMVQRAAGKLVELPLAFAAAQIATRLAPAMRPVTKRDWAALRALAHLDRNTNLVPEIRMPMMRGLPDRLGECPLLTPEIIIGVRDALFDLTDYLDGSMGEWITGKSILTLIAMSERWHREVVLASARMENGSNVVEWPGMFPAKRWEDAGCELIELTTVEELAAEGVAQGHCVATYAGMCLQGHARIVSVRTADGQRLSTVEVVCANGVFAVAQHRAAKNHEPCATAKKAVRRWISEANKGAFPVLREWPYLGTMRHGGHIKPDMHAFWMNERALPATVRAKLLPARRDYRRIAPPRMQPVEAEDDRLFEVAA